MIKVYIASPYTLGNKEENVKRSLKVADELMNNGYIPFVPLLSHYWDQIYPRPYDDWLNLDLEWIKSCDVVLRLDGESKGADCEVARSKELGIPVVYSIGDIKDAYYLNFIKRTFDVESEAK